MTAPLTPTSTPTRRAPRPCKSRWQNRIVGHADVAPDGLIPNPSNPRRHPAAQRAALAGSLDTVGWVAETTVNVRTGNLVDGHARLEEALRRGEPTIPVTYVDLSEDEERLVIATLDPIGAMASFDAARLDELLATLKPENDALAGLLDDLARANGLDALRAGLTDPDDVGPLPEPAAVTVQPGESIPARRPRPPRRGRHVGDRMWAGFSPAPRRRSLPPTRPTGSISTLPGATASSARARHRSGVHRATSLAGDTRADWSEAFALVPSLQVGYVWHAAVQAATVADGLARIGFVIVGQVIWDKTRFTLGRSWYHWAHEPAWVVRRRGARVPFLGERNQDTIWRAPSPKAAGGDGADAPADHPTQKPVLLFETPIAQPPSPRRGSLRSVPRFGHGHHRGRAHRPALLRPGARSGCRPGSHRALAGLHRPEGGAR